MNQKPHTLGNEYHTTAYCETKIIFCVELIEGKYVPTLGPQREPGLKKKFESEIAVLIVRITRSI